MNTHTHTLRMGMCEYTHKNARIYIGYVCMYIYMCVCVCVCVYIYAYIYVCVCVCIYIYIYLHIYVYMCTYTYTYIHTCIHTYIHINAAACLIFAIFFCFRRTTHTARVSLCSALASSCARCGTPRLSRDR